MLPLGISLCAAWQTLILARLPHHDEGFLKWHVIVIIIVAQYFACKQTSKASPTTKWREKNKEFERKDGLWWIGRPVEIMFVFNWAYIFLCFHANFLVHGIMMIVISCITNYVWLSSMAIFPQKDEVESSRNLTRNVYVDCPYLGLGSWLLSRLSAAEIRHW